MKLGVEAREGRKLAEESSLLDRNNDKFDVMIVGAGPVGLTMAIDLGQRGVKTLLVERNPDTGPWPKMDRSNARTMEIYRRLGLVEQVRSVGYPAEASMDVFIVQSLSHAPLLKLHYPSVAQFRAQIAQCSDHSQPLEPYQLVSQNRLEPVLKEAAENTPNVTLLYGHEMIDFDDSGDQVKMRCQMLGRDERHFSGKYLVGCDGGGSRVRKQLGIDLSGQGGLRKMMQICFRSEQLYDNIPMGKGRHYYFTDPEGTAMIVQSDLKEFTINSDVPEGIDYRAWVREKIGPDVEFDFDITNVSPWNLNLLLAERYRKGRVFIAGDAAHLMIPTGGLGMNSGVGDSIDLGWKLAATLQGWGGEALLDSYETERRLVGARNIESSGWAAQGLGKWRALCTGAVNDDSDEGAAIRAQVGREANAHHRRVHEMVGAEYGYSYAGSPIIDGEVGTTVEWDIMRFTPSTAPGVRLPHIWLKDGTSILDLLGPGYTFVDLTGEADTAAIISAFAAARAPLEILSKEEAHVRDSYGCSYLLVRPDLHIVWTGNAMPMDIAALAAMATGHKN